VVAAEGTDTLTKLAGTVAVAFGTINIVGGFLVTDRMLEMFKGTGRRSDAGSEDRKGGDRS
jgi:NAD(P) transhydrogenase subunit alpha